MKPFLYVLYLLIAYAQSCAAADITAAEKVITLPQDQGKWYVSVVGNATDARYNEISGWFDTDLGLNKLKVQIHFCKVTSGTPIFQDRYAGNVKSLPTVRLQKPDGEVVYESAGRSMPSTAAILRSEIAKAINCAGPNCPGGNCPNRNRKQPQPEPPPATPPPVISQPRVDIVIGPPKMDPEPVQENDNVPPLAILLVGGFAVGASVGYFSKVYRNLKASA